MRFFEVKVKLDKVQADGTTKTVSETYALDAMTFTDAEARITKEMQPFITGDFEVMAEKRAQYSEVVFNGGDLFFLVKYNLITIDEVTMKERRKAMYVLFQEVDIDKAKEHAREHMRAASPTTRLKPSRRRKSLTCSCPSRQNNPKTQQHYGQQTRNRQAGVGQLNGQAIFG